LNATACTPQHAQLTSAPTGVAPAAAITKLD
jgi:hypothetical protein